MALSVSTSIEEASSSSTESELSARNTSSESADASSGGGGDSGEGAQPPRRLHFFSSDLLAHGQTRTAYKCSGDVSNESDPGDTDTEKE